jgi:ketosteroid isomerase-like protein
VAVEFAAPHDALIANAMDRRSVIPTTRRMTMADNNPPREIQTLIDNHIDGFNNQNIELFLGVFGDTAIIIDGIAPYRWLNPNAPANWLADVEKWREDLGVSHEHLSYEMGFWNVEGSNAYAVIAGTLAVTIKGQTIARTGTLAYTFSKHGEEWKIDAQAWGRTS